MLFQLGMFCIDTLSQEIIDITSIAQWFTILEMSRDDTTLMSWLGTVFPRYLVDNNTIQ